MQWLRFPLDCDETHFWRHSLLFSHSPIPDLNTLRDYDELSTPLPFVIFGQIKRIFGQHPAGIRGCGVVWRAAIASRANTTVGSIIILEGHVLDGTTRMCRFYLPN